MPILHSQLGPAQAKAPDGRPVFLPPAVSLVMRGPIIQVTITIEANAGKGLLAQGKQLPSPKPGLALIDTGAGCTCIDEQVAQELGLPVIDAGKMTSATHADEPCNVYPIQFTLPPNLTFNCARTMGAKLAAQGIQILIGRDILQRCTLFYNGAVGQFTLSL